VPSRQPDTWSGPPCAPHGSRVTAMPQHCCQCPSCGLFGYWRPRQAHASATPPRQLTWRLPHTPGAVTAGRQPAAEAHVQRAVRRSHHSQRQRSRSNRRRPTRLAISSFKRSSTASTRPARALQGDSDSANRTSSHHIITAATVGRLRPLHALGWQFFSRLGRGPPAPQTRDGASQHRSL
jgi:hypothetical protein